MENGARHSKILKKEYSEQRFKNIIHLQRGELKLLTSFITGHGRFKKHLHTMKVICNPKCKFCEKDETAKHIMCECDAYMKARMKCFGVPFYDLSDF